MPSTSRRSSDDAIWLNTKVDSKHQQQNYWQGTPTTQKKRSPRTKTKRHAGNPEKHQTNVWVGGMLVTVGVTLALIFGLRHK